MNALTGFGLPTRSTRYGERIEAPSFIRRLWEPSDEKTTQGLLELARALGVALRGAGKLQKVLRCLSDVCRAVGSSAHGLVAWPTGSSEMMGRPYGRDVALEVMGALERAGLLSLYQQSSKQDKLARIYQISPVICQPGYKFKMHRDYRPVEIRSERKMLAGKKFGGATLGRRQFLGPIEPLEAQMFRINEAQSLHPLTGKDKEGRPVEHCSVRRIYGSSSLSVGGRVYGSWQTLKEDDRLLLTIDGEQVCEIDVKACFLSLAFAKYGNGQTLPTDPYSEVPFVRDCADPEIQRKLRAACKRLIVCYLCKIGELSQFPKGDMKDDQGRLIPFKSEYGLTQSVQYYTSQIKKMFPFLEQQKLYGENLMNLESNIIVDTMLRLLDVNVVSFPVHDCLLVKKSDQDIVVTVLGQAMMDALQYVPALDITYLDEEGVKKVELVQSNVVMTLNREPKPEVYKGYEVFEEYVW